MTGGVGLLCLLMALKCTPEAQVLITAKILKHIFWYKWLVVGCTTATKVQTYYSPVIKSSSGTPCLKSNWCICTALSQTFAFCLANFLTPLLHHLGLYTWIYMLECVFPCSEYQQHPFCRVVQDSLKPSHAHWPQAFSIMRYNRGSIANIWQWKRFDCEVKTSSPMPYNCVPVSSSFHKTAHHG